MTTATETILIVEDEESDVIFLKRALAKIGVPNPIRSVTNGEEAIAYLQGTGEFSDRKANPFPRVIITDLKMPQMGGLQFLEWIQAHPSFRVVPTIVFTSSTSQADVNQAFKLGAAAYFVKPVEFKDLERIAKIMTDYWRASLLPTREE